MDWKIIVMEIVFVIHDLPLSNNADFHTSDNALYKDLGKMRNC